MPRSAQSFGNPGAPRIRYGYPRRAPAPRRRLTTIHRRLDNLRSAVQTVPRDDPHFRLLDPIGIGCPASRWLMARPTPSPSFAWPVHRLCGAFTFLKPLHRPEPGRLLGIAPVGMRQPVQPPGVSAVTRTARDQYRPFDKGWTEVRGGGLVLGSQRRCCQQHLLKRLCPLPSDRLLITRRHEA